MGTVERSGPGAGAAGRGAEGRPDVYAPARHVADPADCFFYHTMELPGIGLVEGQWDLRGNVDAYLGHVDVRGKRVLELGTASGFLCFEMERRGAAVVGYDLSETDAWDIVPTGGRASASTSDDKRESIRRLNNAWWLAHRLLGSSAKVSYGSVYALPADLGPFDVATFGSILLHVRDPFLALQRAGGLVTETMIVTDVLPRTWTARRSLFARLTGRASRQRAEQAHPSMSFVPGAPGTAASDTWWILSPPLVTRFLQVLGFPHTTTCYHSQRCPLARRDLAMYTVVGRR